METGEQVKVGWERNPTVMTATTMAMFADGQPMTVREFAEANGGRSNSWWGRYLAHLEVMGVLVSLPMDMSLPRRKRQSAYRLMPRGLAAWRTVGKARIGSLGWHARMDSRRGAA